jgi:hypothetical protein
MAPLVRVLREIGRKTDEYDITIAVDRHRDFCLDLNFANRVYFSRINLGTKKSEVVTLQEAMNFVERPTLSTFLARVKGEIDLALHRIEKDNLEEATMQIVSQAMMMSSLRVTVAGVELGK